MKNLILVTFLILAAAASHAAEMTRATAERLLRDRQVNLTYVEREGGRLIFMGENTGGGIPAGRVQAVILSNRAVLKAEILSMDFQPVANGQLNNLDSFRVGGSYHTRQDIRAVLVGR